MLDRTISVAPMMGCTDRHFRYLLRMISPHALLYTEMVVTGALIHGNAGQFLAHEKDGPCALQLGGSNPSDLATCARMAEDAGYQEVNLNVGCPSDRVQYGSIGACLMAEPALVGDCLATMRDAVRIPVTVKSRIGIDDHDDYEYFHRFIETVQAAGTDVFIVHARKAILRGLSPRENRQIPPLKYDFVYRAQADFPAATFVLNGGIDNVETALTELSRVDGVMLGRAPYANPWLLADLEQALHGTAYPTNTDRLRILAEYRNYVDAEIAKGENFKHMGRHLLGYFTGYPGARAFRRYLSEHMFKNTAPASLIDDALLASGLVRSDSQLPTGT
ncbi:MAG: tRNA dihydrouridine(20/20a) synthase DusA [Pseudomonadales bacterium]